MTGDVLVALVERDQLGAVLPAVHRHALGHVARVLDAERGDIVGQLRRAGVPVEQAPAAIADSPLAIMIAAAARCPAAARLLMESGIDRLWIVPTTGAWMAVDDTVLRIAPRRETAAESRSQRPHVPVPGIHDQAVAAMPPAADAGETRP